MKRWRVRYRLKVSRRASTTRIIPSHQVSFPSDTIPDDIFTRICAYMCVPRNYESLAWRLGSAPRTKTPTRLVTDDDLRMALKAGIDAMIDREDVERSNIGRKRKKKIPPPVIVEIINTSPATVAKNSKNKQSMQAGDLAPSMMPYTTELKIVKDTLRCSLHPGDNKWCFVDKGRPDTPHIPLSLSDVQLWAHHLHIDKNADMTCVIPPSTLGFDNIRSRKARTASSAGYRVPTEPLTPVIHNHVHVANPGHANSPGMAESSHMGCRQYAMFLESDDPDDDSVLGLTDILRAIHAKYPDFSYHQYEDQLRQHGILYLSTAGIFDAEFFVAKIGMSEGAGHHFQKWVAGERRKVYNEKQMKSSKKRARHGYNDGEKEDIDPRSAGDAI
ncbi:hypothetical protein BJ138DRAFT_68359 [Hygrophoropsis aurantiaca]|uniref:Uncharacterized protein n=1 Tax=Hygrophoropsis aurantiaca TaxID=72124 RepID=A0ACB8AC85_9AGAM|nr:hypothetical protein BJ138DRAFT_68359 [Hygrophoropsis aurantiaca]